MTPEEKEFLKNKLRNSIYRATYYSDAHDRQAINLAIAVLSDIEKSGYEIIKARPPKPTRKTK